MTQFILFEDTSEQPEAQAQLASRTLEAMSNFIDGNLTEERMLLVTATNLDATLRKQISDSILGGIHTIKPSLIGNLFAAERMLLIQKLMSQKEN